MFRTFETFLVKAAENLSNKIFCLGLVRQEKPPGRQEKACRPGLKPAGPARPSFKKLPLRAARPGLCKAGLAWPLRNTGEMCIVTCEWQDESTCMSICV